MVARFLIDRRMLQYTKWAPPSAATLSAVATAATPSEPDAGHVAGRAHVDAIERVVAEAEVELGFGHRVQGPGPTERATAAPSTSAMAVAPPLPPPPAAASGRCLGFLLVEFLGFYGYVFDPKRHALIGGVGMGVLPPAGCGYVLRDLLAPLLSASNGYAAFAPGDPFSMQPLVCVDPVDQSNNMAKACYRVGLVQRLFAEAATAALATAERLAAATKPATKPGATTMRAAEASLPRRRPASSKVMPAHSRSLAPPPQSSSISPSRTFTGLPVKSRRHSTGPHAA